MAKINFKFLKTKKFIIGAIVVVLIVVIALFARGGNKAPQYETAKVERGNLIQTVDATGKIQSADTLSLNFQIPGIISSVRVDEGSKVVRGQWLANLSLTELNAAVSQAQSSLDQKLAGATAGQIDVAQKQVDSAETALNNARNNLEAATQQQELLVENAYSALLNSGIVAVPDNKNPSTLVPVISGSYNGTAEGQYNISVYQTSAGYRFKITGLETATDIVSTLTPIKMGTRGLYIQFPSLPVNQSDIWTIFIPNTKAANYLTNLNAYNAAKENQRQVIIAAQASVDSAESALALQKANYDSLIAKPRDIDTAYYQAILDQAIANRNKAIITAPISGEVSKVYKKAGELISSAEPMIELLSPHFEIEVDIPETDVVKTKINDAAVITFDAIGTDVKFDGTVMSIEPASTDIQDVVYYKVKVSINDAGSGLIRPGMTANILINTNKKDNALFVPSRAILTRTDSDQKYVRVLGDDNKIIEKDVVVGLKADDSKTEILSGLSEGDTVILKVLTK
ncbi:MAG: HlyD family efflux transporter periplasmic adaptor subunit [Candidatus Paceibacterota bacterium]